MEQPSDRQHRDNAVEPLDLLRFDRRTDHLFRALHNQPIFGSRMYGGQLVAQALAAAGRTTKGWPAHSLHGYFLRAGDLTLPVDYSVDILRDGRSFAARSVDAIQDGRIIFRLTCSFHNPESGYEHQRPMPDDISALLAVRDIVLANAHRVPPALVTGYSDAFPIELRPVTAEATLFEKLDEAQRAFWIRLPPAIDTDEDVAHQCLLAFMSDFWISSAAVGQHRRPIDLEGMALFSLDHAMWFHRPARADDWLLHLIDSPTAQNGRGSSRGLLYDQAGRLVASTAQEVMMRV